MIQGEATEAMLAKAEKDNVPVPKASTAAAKAGSQVPKPKARHTSGPLPEEDPWAMVECQEPSAAEDLHHQVHCLQGRMEQMEHALQQVLGAVQHLASKNP